MRSRILIPAFLVYYLFSGAAYSQDGSLEEKLQLVAQSARQAMESNDIPAISIGVVYRDQVHFLGLGRMRRGSERAVNEHSLYQLASLSKLFVGITAQRLMIDGKLTADRPIVRYLPDLSPPSQERFRSITVEHLLRHRSGLPRTDVSARGKNQLVVSLNYDTDDLLRAFESMQLQSVPGEEFGYSNFGYSLLAHVLEKAAGASYEELLRKLVTAPNEMNDTAFVLNQEQTARVVTAYNDMDRTIAVPPWTMGKLSPPTTLFSSVSDLTKLMRAQIQEYRAHDGQHRSALVLTKPSSQSSPTITAGFGFFDWGDGTLGHNGGMDGYGSEYHICPDQNCGAVFLTSSCGRWTLRLSARINAILRGEQQESWIPFDPTEKIVQLYNRKGQSAALQLYDKLRADRPSPLDVKTRLELLRVAKNTGNSAMVQMILNHAKEDFPQSAPIERAWRKMQEQPVQDISQ